MNLNNLVENFMNESKRKDSLMEKLIVQLTSKNANELINRTSMSIMPDVLRNIEKFNGDITKAKLWLEKLKSAQILHQLPDTYMLETACTRLIGGASYWYETKIKEIHTWKDFILKFTSTFVHQESLSTRWKRMEDKRQKKGECIDSYYHEKVKLCNDLSLDFKEVKEQVLIGPYSKNMCDAMFARQHANTDELFLDLVEYSTIENKRMERIYKPVEELPHNLHEYQKPDVERTERIRTKGSRTEMRRDETEGEVLSEKILMVNTQTVVTEEDQEPIKLEELTIGDIATSEQKEELLELLNKYRECVAKNLKEIGNTNIVEMKIEEIPGSILVMSKPYKTNLLDRQTIKEIVAEWKQTGIVKETTSPYAESIDRLTQLPKSAKLTLKISKCEFAMHRIEYLGYIVQQNRIESGPRKAEAIRSYPTPKNSHEIRRFIGLASFFRRLVPHFALVVEPLTRLTRKDKEFKWTDKQQIKLTLSTRPSLIYNPLAKKTELHTDACTNGLEAILLQSDDSDVMHPVYAISRKTTEPERSYHSSKLELLAVERPGSQMQHVDAISRAPIEDSGPDTEETVLEKLCVYSIITSEEEIALFQYSDDVIQRKITIL
ncbi:hypothetical protein Trydic_g16290 [Trypoxylus dichotomus]